MTMRPITPYAYHLHRMAETRSAHGGRRSDAGRVPVGAPTPPAGSRVGPRHGLYVRGMRALRSFTVRPALPPALAPLHELAMNLRWSWDERTRDLFRWVDPEAWEQTGHDPVRLLGMVSRER